MFPGIIRLIFCALALVCATAKIFARDRTQDGMEIAGVVLRNRAMLTSLPMYTCLETISRQQQTSKQRTARNLDLLQVDVGVAEGTEIYSWPGEKKFGSRSLTELIGQGFVGTGTFETFLRNLFLVNAASITRTLDEGMIEGKRAIRFTFEMPRLNVNWKVNWLGAEGTAGEAGEFWVDKQTKALLQLRVEARDIPPNIPLSEVFVKIDYQQVNAKTKDVLIPRAAELTAVEWNGTLHRDVIGFSQCHVFQAESHLLNSADALPKLMENYESQREELPDGLKLSIALSQELLARHLVIGSPLAATLAKPVKISSRLSIPAGAIVEGRVRVFQAMEEDPSSVLVGLSFDEIRWPGHVGVFSGDITQMQQLIGMSSVLTRQRSMSAGSSALMNVTTEKIRPIEIPGITTFFLERSQALPRGLQMTLKTRKLRNL